MNVYARIITDEAERRGIKVTVIDGGMGLFRLEHRGRSILCRESLTERTSAIAMTICDDKRLTHHILAAAGFRVPVQEAPPAEPHRRGTDPGPERRTGTRH